MVGYMLPAVLVGIPLGAWLIRKLEAETFRRICMGFDTLIVGFGLSRSLQELNWVSGPAAFLVLAVAFALNIVLLIRFFKERWALN